MGKYNTDLLREDFFNIIEILTNSNNSCSDFLKAIETFKSKYVNKLYLDMISSKEIQLTENTFKIMMKYLSKNLNENNSISNETFLYLLEKSNGKEEFVKAIIEVISSCFLQKGNFLGEDDTNYKIFKLLYNFNYFNVKPKWFISSQYYHKTMDSIEYIIGTLINLKITFTEFNFLFRHYGDKLLENLNIICLGDAKKANEIIEKLNEEKKRVYQLQTRLNDLINCYKYFFPNSKKLEIDEITDFQHKITTYKISDLKGFQISRKINNFSNEAAKHSRLFNLYNSIFFMTLYRENRNKIHFVDLNSQKMEEDLIKNTETEYNKLRILFNDNENAKKLNALDIFYEELKKADSRIDIVRKEINFLKNYFNYKDYISKDLESYIIIYLSKEEIKILFLGILTFIEACNLRRLNFTKLINEYMKEIDNKNIKNQKSKEIVDFINDKLNVKYDYEKDEQPDMYSECIKLLIGRGNCFHFALGKDESEIRNLNEFLGMDENPLLQNDDIQSFGKVTPFINSISQECRLKSYDDEKIYQYFNQQLHEDDYLLKSFKEYINKYGLLENLYNEYLNKPEVSKTKIFSIINDSKIEIENYYKGESIINVHCQYKGD